MFDLDGLLVDSEDAWWRAEQRVVESYGRAWDPTVRKRMLGTGPAEAAGILAASMGVGDAAEVWARLLDEVAEEFAAGMRPRPGAAALVEALGSCVPLAVATNSQRALAEQALTSSGLVGAFTAVVCVDDVAAPKPAPDVYLAACRRLGAPPGACVAFEDSPVGARSAAAAGLWVIGCPSLPGTRVDSAAVVVDSLSDVQPASWFDPEDEGYAVTSLASRGRRDRPV